jgi:hypothetical protein
MGMKGGKDRQIAHFTRLYRNSPQEQVQIKPEI